MSDSIKSPNSIDLFRIKLLEGAQLSSVYEFPIIKKVDFQPEKAIPFDRLRSRKPDQWLQFYIHDYKFECVWKDPFRYLPIFKEFEGVITPDYSLYYDMPKAMQIWNTYRNRALGHWMQHNGINIIPNIRWNDEKTYAFAFEGIECGGTVAVSTLGVLQNKYDRYLFQKGFNKMVEAIEPNRIICYGSMPAAVFEPVCNGKISVIKITSHTEAIHNAKGGV